MAAHCDGYMSLVRHYHKLQNLLMYQRCQLLPTLARISQASHARPLLRLLLTVLAPTQRTHIQICLLTISSQFLKYMLTWFNH